MKTIQPVSIMESEWFRYYQLYNSLLKWAEQGLTVKNFKDDMTQFFKDIEPIKKECKYDYLEQRILYATFLEMCDKSLVPDDTQLTELVNYIKILVDNTLDEIISWSEEK